METNIVKAKLKVTSPDIQDVVTETEHEIVEQMPNVTPSLPKRVRDLPKLGYTTKEAAQILGFKHEDSVLKLIHRGDLRPLPQFRHKIIPLVELERFCRDSVADSSGGKKKGRGR